MIDSQCFCLNTWICSISKLPIYYRRYSIVNFCIWIGRDGFWHLATGIVWCAVQNNPIWNLYSFVAQLNFERVSIWHFHFSMHLIYMHDNIVPRKNRIRNNSIRIGHWMRKPSLVWHYIYNFIYILVWPFLWANQVAMRLSYHQEW